jgi:hypothetical protein
MTDCVGVDLAGTNGYAVWIAGSLAVLAIGAIGSAQTRHAEPLSRAPFGAMIAVGLACLVVVDGSVAVTGYLLSAAVAVAAWIGAACAVDDLLEWAGGGQAAPVLVASAHAAAHAWLAGTALMEVSLRASAAASAASAALVLRNLGVANQLVVAIAFRCAGVARDARAAASPTDAAPPVGDTGAATADATVLRCADLACVAAGLTAACSVCETALGLRHDCPDFRTVHVLGAVLGLATVFYMVMATAAARLQAGRRALSCGYVLWRGVVPVVSDTCTIR